MGYRFDFCNLRALEAKMKKLMLSVLSGVFLVALFAVAQTEVASINIVGYSKRSVNSNDWVMLSVNFDKVGGGTNTLLDIFGTNQLKQASNLTLCDKIIMFNPSTYLYQTYAQKTGVFYKANDVTEWNLKTVASDTRIPVGTAFWFVPGYGATNKTFNLMGQVVTVATQKIDLVNNWQLLSSPFTCDFALSNSAFFANGASRAKNLTLCDKVITYDGTNYQTYALFTNGLWYYANNVTEWNTSRSNGVVSSNVFQLGEGFWYIAISNMVWSETNKYLQNLL